MELYNTIYKAPPILNYAALYELRGSITFYRAPWNRETHRNSKELQNYHMYQNFTSRHFSKHAGIIFFVNWLLAYCGVLRLTEASSLRPDSPRASARNETVKLRRRQMTVANSPVQWPSWTWCRTWWNHSWHSNFKSALFCLHSSAHSSGV